MKKLTAAQKAHRAAYMRKLNKIDKICEAQRKIVQREERRQWAPPKDRMDCVRRIKKLTAAVKANDIVKYSNRRYRIVNVMGKKALLFPLDPTPRDRERGPLTVNLSKLSK